MAATRPRWGVAGDQPDTAEAALDEAAQEQRPGIALVVAGGQLEPEDPVLASARHADRHERGHVHHPATVADLGIRGVEEQVRIALVGQRAGSEDGHLIIERGADPADLAAAHRGDAEGLDKVLHPARADAGHVRLQDDRREGPLGWSAVVLRSMSSTAVLSSAIVVLLRRWFSLQRREDDAMADSLVSRSGCYTIICDTSLSKWSRIA